MGRVELLAPGGNYSKMMTAFEYGADAVYIGSDAGFGLRSNCDNFTLEETRRAVEYANEHGKKIYVTLNIFPRDTDIERMVQQAEKLYEIGVHGVIVSDLGAFTAIHAKVPDLDIHVSTQANNLNSATCRVWKNMGATRVNLARELTFEEIKNIAFNVGRDIELEVFVHGAMCMSYSGRCMLSDYMTGRSSNRGDCAQPCRWEYLRSNGDTDTVYIQEDKYGTYLFNSKDLCLLPYLPDMVKAGVHALKIEGRMKSEFYTALTVRAYRIALDIVENGGELTPEIVDELLKEVNMVSHRDYSTGFFLEGIRGAQVYGSSSYLRDADFVGIVSECEATDDDSAWRVVISQRSVFEEGDIIEFVTPSQEIHSIIAQNMYDDKGEKVIRANHAKMNVHTILPFYVKPGTVIRKPIRQN